MKNYFRHIIAVMLLLTAINGLAVSFGECAPSAAESPSALEAATSPFAGGTVQIGESSCPCVPSPFDTFNDHFCDGNCNCPCQAPLCCTPLSSIYSPSLASLDYTDYVPYIPEVYLDRFIPPQNQA